jgi:hypothetical protein
MAAWAIEQHPIEALVTAGLREADHLAKLYALDPAAASRGVVEMRASS